MTLQPNSDVTSRASDRRRGGEPIPTTASAPTLRQWDWVYLAFFFGSLITFGVALAVAG